MKPKNIEGYMGKGPLRWLEEQGSRHDVIVEVGAWLGRGTAALARRCATGTIYSVDTWEGVPDDDQQQGLYAHVSDPYKVWEANVRPFILSGAVVPQRGTSLEIAAEWLLSGKSADMVFIDADHRYGAVLGDMEAWSAVLRPGGILSGHDFHWPGVERAVRETFGDDFERGPGSIWWRRV
jgi:predicted O-methyltransferase YrrM